MRKILISENIKNEFKKLEINVLDKLMNEGKTTYININCFKNLSRKKMAEFKYLLLKYRYNVYAFSKYKNKKCIKSFKIKYIDNISQLEPIIKDFSSYERIYHIGDIHAYYKELMECFIDIYNPNYLFIFTGDYIDKGYDNVNVLKFLINISNLDNVILLEGNHDKYIHLYALGEYVKNRRSFYKTFLELKKSELKKEEILGLSLKLKEFLLYKYNGDKFLITHGGMDKIPEKFINISSNSFISERSYNVKNIDKLFMLNSKKNEYQIHGHNNPFKLSPTFYDRSINLEGNICNRGHIVTCYLTNENGINKFRYKKYNKGIDYEFRVI